MDEKLEQLILRSQNMDEEAQSELIEKFNPLLKKYASKLKYDDAYYDLRLDFLELIKRINSPH